MQPSVAPRRQGGEAGFRAWLFAGWVAAVFALLVGVNLVMEQVRAKSNDPFKSPELRALKEQLRLKPTDKQLKQTIRELDLRLRTRYFHHLSQMNTGVWLLLGGTAAAVFAARQAGACRKRLPMPGPKSEEADKAARFATTARWAVGASGVAFGALLFALSLSLGGALPKRTAELEKLLGGETAEPAPTTPTAASDVVSLDELRQNWPRFRGADGSGVSVCTNPPLNWDAKSGAGIAWKVTSPAQGFGSPIVWADRVFFSAGDATRREVLCLDGKTGQVLWRQPVPSGPGTPAHAEVPESTGYAASTIASDGRRVYALFANGDCGAFTLEGKLVWSKSFGALKNPYGHATSLATWRDRLIVQLDQGDVEDGKSKLYALDGLTGQIAWQRPRKTGATWATPIVFEAGGKPQVIALAAPHVIAYAATDGAELWQAECLNGEITPSPVFAGGLLFVASPSEKLLAIRPDGQGDVSKTHIAWSSEESVPDVTSPTSNGELVFDLTTSGMLTCLDAKDGKKQWEHDFEMEFHASPSIAGNKLYLFSQKGTAFVVDASRQFKEVFRAEMGDGFHASPAFAQDRIYLRGITNVWCVGAAR